MQPLQESAPCRLGAYLISVLIAKGFQGPTLQGLVIHGPPPVPESYSTMPLREGGAGRTEILPAADFSKESPTKLTTDSSTLNA